MQAVAVMKERLKAQGGRLNALVNNAAISPKGERGARLGSIETDHRDWMQVFQVNFFAPIMLARGLIDELQAGSGAVVNVSSIAGSRVHPFAGSAYATSKAALAASPARWPPTSPRLASGSTPSRRGRSTPRSCRQAPRH
jgi:NAD(P)-dependent dehydrogenase (short-subunit alcohol dehydrogenase family)